MLAERMIMNVLRKYTDKCMNKLSESARHNRMMVLKEVENGAK